ncbi:unnamed protein product [Mytilus edulis]|uniref:Ankyrin repeat protein n=1 Tax=Mytilus edulis TaxID=6550 RepID=A0A8S3PLV0_MYTED|nr:unnamed protein product [Mytilus edulis]
MNIVKLLVEIGLSTNARTKNDCIPLYLACEKGQYNTVKFLSDLKELTLNTCVDTTIQDENGWSVMRVAYLKGHTEVVKVLIEVASNDGQTPLYLAYRRGCHDIVKYLLDLNDQTFKSRVDTTTRDEKGWSVLHTACYYGHTEIVKLLIDDGMNVNDTTT